MGGVQAKTVPMENGEAPASNRRKGGAKKKEEDDELDALLAGLETANKDKGNPEGMSKAAAKRAKKKAKDAEAPTNGEEKEGRRQITIVSRRNCCSRSQVSRH